MDTTITYDMVKALVSNPPTLGDRPKVFNLCALQNHFVCTLKQIPCPKLQINGWACFVLTPAMHALVNPKPFDLKALNLPTTSGVPKFLLVYKEDGITNFPYMHEQMLKIATTLNSQKNNYNTAYIIYCAVYNTLNAHIDNAFKVAPATTPPTIEWNSSMSLNNIFNQMMKMYSRLTLNAMQQNMMTFLSPYIPQDPPKILFKLAPTVKKLP
jgi:hypothetical protein